MPLARRKALPAIANPANDIAIRAVGNGGRPALGLCRGGSWSMVWQGETVYPEERLAKYAAEYHLRDVLERLLDVPEKPVELFLTPTATEAKRS